MSGCLNIKVFTHFAIYDILVLSILSIVYSQGCGPPTVDLNLFPFAMWSAVLDIIPK
jgi:hypothetical protein